MNMHVSNGLHSYDPVQGKTYSLFGDSASTDEYYQRIASIADDVSSGWKDEEALAVLIRRACRRKSLMGRARTLFRKDKAATELIRELNSGLHEFTLNAEEHLKHLSLFKRTWDRRLGTSLEQYHLYMLEIELTNRRYRQQFIQADVKIALLPHCLRDFTTDCKAKADDFDYRCRHCSGICYENYISSILEKQGINAYIWMGAHLGKKAREVQREGKSFAVLGIACIPELYWGMRKCRKLGLPVIGLPLDANRCARWMGQFHRNSVNLAELERLVGQKTS